MTYKQLITKLQILPMVAIPVAIYPEEEGTYGTSRYYCTAQDGAKVYQLTNFLPYLNNWKNIAIIGRGSSYLQKLSNDITKDIVTPYGKAKAIHDWVFYNIDYMQTPSLIPPETLAKTRAGDCKSFSVLIATLLGIQEIPCWFKLVQFKGDTARHIYDYVSLTWQPIDGTGYFCFEEVQRVIGYMLFEVDKTYDSPPRALPSPVEAEEAPPPLQVEQLKEFAPLLVAGGIFLALTLAGGGTKLRKEMTTKSLI